MRYWENKVLAAVLMLCVTQLYGQDIQQETESYWAQINRKADQLFGGLNMEFKLDVGVEKQAIAGYKDNPYSDLTVSIPLYSTSERQAQQAKKQAYLHEAAELLNQYEQSALRSKVLTDKERLLRVLLKDAGMKEAENYFQVKEAIIEADTTVKALKRKIVGLLK